MTTQTTLLVAGGLIIGAILWKKVGEAKNAALAQAAAATASANKVAQSINDATKAAQPITGALGEALGYVGNMFSSMGQSNLKNSYSGPGGGQYI